MLCKLPEGTTTCSWNGVEFHVNVDGLVDLPEGALDELKWHGVKKHTEPPQNGARHAFPNQKQAAK
jgi:hypothetical protein